MYYPCRPPAPPRYVVRAVYAPGVPGAERVGPRVLSASTPRGAVLARAGWGLCGGVLPLGSTVARLPAYRAGAPEGDAPGWGKYLVSVPGFPPVVYLVRLRPYVGLGRLTSSGVAP